MMRDDDEAAQSVSAGKRQEYEKEVAARHMAYIFDLLSDTSPASARASFARAGLDYDECHSHPDRIGAVYPYALLHELNQDECCPGICLRFGVGRQVLDLGVFGYAMLSCPDLRMAMQIMVKFHRLLNVEFEIDVTIDGRWTIAHQWINPTSLQQRVVLEEEHVAGIWRLLSSLLWPRPRPADLHIELTQHKPAYSELYRELIGCAPDFGKPEAFVAFPRSWLDRRIQGAESMVKEVCQSRCEALMQELEPVNDTVDTVRRLILAMPPNESATLDGIATKMRISPRSLERRLLSSGSSFRKINNGVRMQLAEHYLSTGYLSVKEVAFLLGYAQAGTFIRAFRVRHGMTPTEYQRARSVEGGKKGLDFKL